MRWPMVPLGSLAEVVGGSTPSRQVPEYWGGSIPWATPTDLPMPGTEIAALRQTSESIAQLGLESSAANLLPVGAVLFSSRATIGKLAIAEVPVATNQGFANFICGPCVYNRYLAWALFNSISAIERLAGSTTFKEITKTALKAFRIPLPPISEQRRIVELLDEADRLRKLRGDADAKAARILPALFLKMFGDPATNPKGWPVRTLEQCLSDAEVFVDGDWVESKDQDPNGEVRLIQLADIGDGRYLNKSSRYLTKTTAIRLKCTFLQIDDVLVARMPDPLGRACLFPGDSKESVTVVDVCVIRPRKSGPDPMWLMCAINTSSFRNAIASYATGTTRERISRGNLSRLRIITPPVELQRRFASDARSLDRVIGAVNVGPRIEALFSTMLSQAFSGQLTARWRDGHMKELVAEIQQQVRLLDISFPSGNRLVEA